MHAPRPLRRALAALVALAAGVSAAGGDESRFVVTPEVIAPKPPGLTASYARLGWGVQHTAWGAMEPGQLRTRLYARKDSADQILAPAHEYTEYDTLREGAWDGATVDVHRVVNGELVLVRRDRVKAGGHASSGWLNLLGGGGLAADSRRAAFAWSGFHRPAAPQWFALRGVAADGTRGPVSRAVRGVSPDKPSYSQRSELERADLPKAPKTPKPGAEGPKAPSLHGVMLPDGRIELTWTPAPGGVEAAAWELLQSYVPPEKHRGYSITLEGGADKTPIRNGDMAFLRKDLPQRSRKTVLSDRVWNTAAPHALPAKGLRDAYFDEDPGLKATLVPHPPDTPVSEPGKTFLRLKTGPGRTPRIMAQSTGAHAANQTYYEVLEPGVYTLDIWFRAPRPVSFALELIGRKPDFAPIVMHAGPKWRRYIGQFELRGVDTKGHIGGMALAIPENAEIDIDNFRVYRAEAGWNGLLPRDLKRLRAAGLEAMRNHRWIKSGYFTYDLRHLVDRGADGETLPYMMEQMQAIGTNPWMQVEPHFSPEEWLGLVEWLAAPADAGPWAALRAKQGREAPWADAFERIYFEVGNETWNNLFAPWTFWPMTDAATGAWISGGQAYGMLQEHVIQTMKQSPWWPALEGKMEFVLGGFALADSGYSKGAAIGSPSSDHVTFAAYMAGWDVGEGAAADSPQTYVSTLNSVRQLTDTFVEGHERFRAEVEAARGRPVKFGTYEAGPGYALNGLNGATVTPEEAAAQERVMKSQAAGVATLDTWLSMAERGYALQNFFTYSPGRRWTSHARWQNGGQTWPSWDLLTLYSRIGRGEFLRVETRETPVLKLEKGFLRRALDAAPQTRIYAARDGDRLIVYVLSRRAPHFPDPEDPGCDPLEARLPISGARSLTLYAMAGDYRANNLTAKDVKIERRDLPVPADASRLTVGPENGGKACGMPPASALIYVYEGVEF